jgi:hypothetical protein
MFRSGERANRGSQPRTALRTRRSIAAAAELHGLGADDASNGPTGEKPLQHIEEMCQPAAPIDMNLRSMLCQSVSPSVYIPVKAYSANLASPRLQGCQSASQRVERVEQSLGKTQADVARAPRRWIRATSHGSKRVMTRSYRRSGDTPSPSAVS